MKLSCKMSSEKKEALVPMFEGSAEEKMEKREEEEEEVEEEYVLPAIPDVPLSGENPPHVPSASSGDSDQSRTCKHQTTIGKLGPSQQHWDIPSPPSVIL